MGSQMVRIIASILLIFTLLGHSFHNWAVYISYSVNKDFIKEVLCINKDNEKLQCDGKCFLKSSFEKNDKGHDKNSMPSPDRINTAFLIPTAHFTLSKKVIDYSCQAFHTLELSDLFDLSSLFRPPRQ